MECILLLFIQLTGELESHLSTSPPPILSLSLSRSFSLRAFLSLSLYFFLRSLSLSRSLSFCISSSPSLYSSAPPPLHPCPFLHRSLSLSPFQREENPLM